VIRLSGAGAGVKQNTSRRIKKTKAQIYEEEILKNATPSEEAVRNNTGTKRIT
jgi:hypothetical protein